MNTGLPLVPKKEESILFFLRFVSYYDFFEKPVPVKLAHHILSLKSVYGYTAVCLVRHVPVAPGLCGIYLFLTEFQMEIIFQVSTLLLGVISPRDLKQMLSSARAVVKNVLSSNNCRTHQREAFFRVPLQEDPLLLLTMHVSSPLY